MRNSSCKNETSSIEFRIGSNKCNHNNYFRHSKMRCWIQSCDTAREHVYGCSTVKHSCSKRELWAICSMHWPLCDAHKFIRYLYLEFCLLFSLSLIHFALLVYKFAWVSKKSVHNDVGGNFSNFNTNKQCKMIQLTICNIRRFSVFRFFFFFFSHLACEINCKLF